MLQYLPFLRADYEGLKDLNPHERPGLCTLVITRRGVARRFLEVRTITGVHYKTKNQT